MTDSSSVRASTSARASIADYGIIGDCGSAALVSRHGSIDWLCWPRFDSPSVFAALLDAERGGHFRIRPTAPYSAHRRYIGSTNVLETTFTTERGVLRLTDSMSVAPAASYDRELWPDHEVLRIVECTAGRVEVEVSCCPRPGYGRTKPHLKRRGKLGYFVSFDGEVLVLRTEFPLTVTDDRTLAATVALDEGTRRAVSLTYEWNEPAVLPPLGTHANDRLDRSLSYWSQWIQQCTYEGPYRGAVMRSALTLKLMTFASSGAVVAAPTTSLPEVVGGELNWDYRYCWIRDAAFVLRALFRLGFRDEEEAFLSWLLQATRTTLPRVNVAYDVFGGPPPDERTLDHLDGYRGSQPVRVGNQAHSQFQLDLYGEVISAAHEYIERGRTLDRFQSGMLAKLGSAIEKRWAEPDAGIWEIREVRYRHTYSLAMCWIGLDRLLAMHADGHVDIPADRFRTLRDEIKQTIERRGYHSALDSYVATLDGETLDASLLLMAFYGYASPQAPRMRSTWDCIDARLGQNGLLYRYLEDGSTEEGAFGICSFWAAEYLARRGDVDAAAERFEQVLAFANDLDLFAEEIDPQTGAALGNVPQAFTHVGLINAALQIADAQVNASKT